MLAGPWCHSCGQRDLDLHRGLFQLVTEGLSEVFEFDGRIPRSLGALLLRPGELARRWLDGERARFSSPVRLYLFAVVVALFAVGFAGHSSIDRMATTGWIRVPATDGVENVVFSIGPPDQLNYHYFHYEFDRSDMSAGDAGMYDLMAARPPELATRDLFQLVLDQVPAVLVLLMVLTALLLKLGWWRRLLIEHAVFSLTLHTVLWYALAVAVIVPRIGVWVALLTAAAHLILGLRRVYGSGWPRTLLAATLLAGSWSLAFSSLWILSTVQQIQSRGELFLQAQERAATAPRIEDRPAIDTEE